MSGIGASARRQDRRESRHSVPRIDTFCHRHSLEAQKALLGLLSQRNPATVRKLLDSPTPSNSRMRRPMRRGWQIVAARRQSPTGPQDPCAGPHPNKSRTAARRDRRVPRSRAPLSPEADRRPAFRRAPGSGWNARPRTSPGALHRPPHVPGTHPHEGRRGSSSSASSTRLQSRGEPPTTLGRSANGPAPRNSGGAGSGRIDALSHRAIGHRAIGHRALSRRIAVCIPGHVARLLRLRVFGCGLLPLL